MNKSTKAFKDGRSEKSFKINTPTRIPLNSETKTFLVRRANTIAKREGKRERADGSMI